MLNKVNICLPFTINILIWKKNKFHKNLNVILYSNDKKINFFSNTESNLLRFDKNTNTLIIEKNYLYEKNNKISNFIENFLKSWDFYFFSKIKFKGKGFRIRFLKKNKLVKFFFGRSHKTFIKFKKIIMKKINKYKFILKSINKKKILNNSYKVVSIKPLNLYTIRGLRNSRQIVCKRKGKKGTYI